MKTFILTREVKVINEVRNNRAVELACARFVRDQKRVIK